MREWRSVTVGEFCPFLYGKSLPENIRKEGNIPVVSSSGVTGRHDTALVQTKGIVIGRKGTVGKITRIQEPFWPIDTAFYIADEPKKKDLNFTYYLLQTLGLEHMNSDSAVPGLNRNNAHARTIHVPPLPEQKAIASVLGALDDKIALNRRMCKTLESMAQALFKSWFVDFDPVHAKMRGEQPYGMDAETAALFPDKLVDSELGLIPEGWVVDDIGKLVEIVGGGTPKTQKTEYWVNGKHAWATPKDLSSLRSSVLLSTERKITDSGLSSISSGLLPVGTVLMSSRAPIGYIALAEIPVAINQGFISLICQKNISNLYVWQWLNVNLKQIKNYANGSTFQEISKGSFRALRCLCPSNKAIDFYDRVIMSVWKKIVISEKECLKLEQLRDYLLPKLVSGEVSVK